MGAIYDSAKEALLDGRLSWTRDSIRAVLVDLGRYRPNFATHALLSPHVPPEALVGQGVALERRTAAGGVAGAADAIFPRVRGRASGVLVYRDGGAPDRSELLALLDDVSGLPLEASSPGGLDVVLSWEGGKVFWI